MVRGSKIRSFVHRWLNQTFGKNFFVAFRNKSSQAPGMLFVLMEGRKLAVSAALMFVKPQKHLTVMNMNDPNNLNYHYRVVTVRGIRKMKRI